ncbi:MULTISPECIES: DNA mismatch repair endonuclease MutL [Turicibacter]|jgi:DNA mismatch repair protein mutL|uniref:DNA mismatch repair protein MutL n=2 Tax=Turicibacter sanguinis TaxID=154288 RepID=A0A9X4XBG2_9FIRM|nr:MULTISPECIES: DNA mismatch repair endonuclease MutL [Turicibacter]EFF63028.1 DNA mismatch repair protein, C-terminal domain protein [Turicibacter sanguinis PC909]EGC91327.1 DNA mismatch repair protein MutL [Turicibacter sp. HGF1]MCU7197083.1 DNA mismatch repair endonuclease MutL [Turicibacter sanguinis]MCU7202643.1 DNA mismatch repair endonuclease MutL [Turicibacter sanguinis]MCU7211115.1 DNA mismatch repair endonuclease MutL [Turicibacter sanguinis]
MGKIRRMSEQLANMIAAGEVIERPASVVKELLENAIDANSTSIEIQLQDSGVRQIRVIDNGEGMSESDALLAFERHATSKVKTQYDIFRIQTLGFRGEALPSIASVSDVHVKTSDGASSGVHLNIKAGEVLVNEPGVMRKGTEMEVNHLFFNTPARLKHIKSLNTELSHITDYLNKIALSHPEIAFKLLNNQRLLFQTNGQNNLQSVIASVYGFDVAKKMIPFSAKNDDFEISGFLSDPIINRASRNYVTIIVNGRAIRNYNLMRSIIEAYHTLLPKDKYPIVVLNLKLDPILVDVNVHPAKLEVRFSQEESLKTFIYHELRNVLKQVEYIPETQIEEPKVVMPKPIQQTLSLTKEATFKPTIAVQMVDENPIELKKESVDVKKESVHVEEVAEPMVSLEQPAQDFKVVVPTRQAIPQLELHYIGQLHGTYLLAQNEEGLFIVDQHAAMERIQYEKNYALLKDVKGDCIELIIPMVLKYSANELLLLKESLPSLMKFGFEIEEFGGQSLVVRTIPVWVQNLDAKLIVETILQQIIYDNKVDIGKLRESVAIMMSCKGSIKANQYINEHEIKQMLVDLCLCDQPYTCPHGRPIIVKLTKYEIEKLFKRVM